MRDWIDRALVRNVQLSPFEIVGAGLAVAWLLWLSTLTENTLQVSLFAAPLAASIAIMFTTPGMTVTRTWNVIAGQTISAFVALVTVLLIPGMDGKLAAPLALAAALFAMRLFRCLHPPACATAMIVCLAPAAHQWIFLLFPVLTGSIVIVVFAWLVHVIEARVPPRWGGRTTPGHGQP